MLMSFFKMECHPFYRKACIAGRICLQAGFSCRHELIRTIRKDGSITKSFQQNCAGFLPDLSGYFPK